MILPRMFFSLLSMLLAITTYSQEPQTIYNLNASGGTVYFSLASGKETGADKSNTPAWDISFAKTTISVNEKGKVTAQVVSSTFEALKKAPESGYRPDTDESKAIPTGSGNGWYHYNMEDHTILPIADRTIVVKASDGKKYKIKIISYNKDQKLFESTGYYTFRYIAVD